MTYVGTFDSAVSGLTFVTKVGTFESVVPGGDTRTFETAFSCAADGHL